MHLLIPHASVFSEACVHTLHDLQLPRLSKLLPRLTSTQLDLGDEDQLSLPHERALGFAYGWQGEDGCLPWGAHLAAADGIDVGDAAWALLTPAHMHVGTDQITLVDPDELKLDAGTSRALLEEVRELFESLGWRVEWGAALRWYASHESLRRFPAASIDRAIGRNIDAWLPRHVQARALRGLQNEVQMQLYGSPMNDERTARHVLPVNSFWISGCGARQPVTVVQNLVVDDRLRKPALDQDWAGWAEAWRQLDAGPIDDLLARASRGGAVAITLCGERSAQRFELRPQPWFAGLARAFRSFNTAALLESL